MAADASRLSEREREVLRLILQGHDAKSIAREQQLSIHVVNERLRAARRKLCVSSTREAARLLAAIEGGAPNNVGHKEFGIEARTAPAPDERPANSRAAEARPRAGIAILGVAMILTAVTIAAAVSMRSESDAAPTPEPATAPRVLSTQPANGSVIKPGQIALTVTFDRPMRRGSYSFVQTSPDTYPDCGSHQPEISADGRTFRLSCAVRPGRSYEIWFNRQPYMNFVAEDGTPAQPFQLRFRTRTR